MGSTWTGLRSSTMCSHIQAPHAAHALDWPQVLSDAVMHWVWPCTAHAAFMLNVVCRSTAGACQVRRAELI